MKVLVSFLDWVLVREFDRDEVTSVRRINKRQIRGNVRAQYSRVLTRRDLDMLAKKADKAMKSLSRFERTAS